MIQPITKLVTIAPPTDHQRSLFQLDTADGRWLLAERLQNDIETWCKQAFDDGPRTHLGASVIGAECDRQTWYSWRWFKHKLFSGRMQRLFQDGHWYEERFIEMLRGIGCNVSQVNEAGEQHRIYACEGHFGGSTDGGMMLPPSYGLNFPFLAEFKTINDKNFAKVHDVQNDKPQHWGQMCVYGVKLGLRFAVYFLVNKNDASLKIEVVELDWNHGNMLIQKGQWIITSPVPPPRISDNPSDWRCKMCDYHALCQLKTVQPDVNCRTCKHSQAIDNKEWRCNLWQQVIPSKEAMLAGCSSHVPLLGE